MDYQVMVRGEYVADDGLSIAMVSTDLHQLWYEVPLPPCPDCGGALAWGEVGYVPGTRRCVGRSPQGGCGSMFSVDVRPGQGHGFYLCRAHFYF